MDEQEIVEKLAANTAVFEALCKGISERQWRWKPEENNWSMLEVVHHLLDEERDDFRTRLDYTLHKPGVAWPAIDPPKWVTERNYNERNPSLVLTLFHEERERSVQWLNNLNHPDWDAFYDHPQAGKMSARRILANWLAHDYLHIRQLGRLQWQYLANGIAPVNLSYAGPAPQK